MWVLLVLWVLAREARTLCSACIEHVGAPAWRCPGPGSSGKAVPARRALAGLTVAGAPSCRAAASRASRVAWQAPSSASMMPMRVQLCSSAAMLPASTQRRSGSSSRGCALAGVRL